MKKPGFALLSNSIPGDVILGGLPGFIMLLGGCPTACE